MKDIFLLLIYVFGMVFGQVLFKRVAGAIKGVVGYSDMAVVLLSSAEFYVAIFVYGVLTIYWIWLLRWMSISYAYPFVALSIAIVVFIGWIGWGEKVGLLQVFGVLFVLLGVVLIGLSDK